MKRKPQSRKGAVDTFQWTFPFLIFLLLVFRLWPSDRWHIIGALAYIPTPLLLLAACASALLLFIRSRRIDILPLVFVLVPLAFVIWENRGFLGSDAPGSSLKNRRGIRVFHWNIWGARKGIEPIMSEIKKHNPDIICLSEHWQHRTRKRLPYLQLLDGVWYEHELKNILVLSRFPLDKVRNFNFKGVYGIQARISEGSGFSFLFLDASPEFGYNRRETFSQFIKQPDNPPDIILGDFNTPPLSYSIRSTLGEHYREVYGRDTGESGYTWPSWFPMLRIDLIFTNGRHTILAYRMESSDLSDHRWHYVDLKRETTRVQSAR